MNRINLPLNSGGGADRGFELLMAPSALRSSTALPEDFSFLMFLMVPSEAMSKLKMTSTRTPSGGRVQLPLIRASTTRAYQ